MILLGSKRERASIVAFALALLGLVLSIAVVLGSESDPAQVRWWLVVAPVLVATAPLLVPQPPVRLAAMLVLGAWCIVTGFSIGMLLLPALVVMVLAVVRDAR